MKVPWAFDVLREILSDKYLAGLAADALLKINYEKASSIILQLLREKTAFDSGWLFEKSFAGSNHVYQIELQMAKPISNRRSFSNSAYVSQYSAP